MRQLLVTSLAQAELIAGTLGEPSKMPGYAYGISATICQIGTVLQKVKGSVCSKCYAMRGHYQHKGVKLAHQRRQSGLFHPLWVDALAFMINYRKDPYFRWHDSGDLQGLWHLKKIAEVCVLTPDTTHWLPTREQGMVREYFGKYGTFPPNLTVRVSATMIDGPPPASFPLTSTVVTHDHTCPAPEQDNACGKCRKCWDPGVVNIAYRKH